MSGSFLKEIAIGRHVEGNSPLHHARASWKACLFGLVAISTFFFSSAGSFLALGIVLGLLSLSCQIPQRLFWRSLRPVNLLALFTILAGAFINHQGASPLAPSFSWQGLHTGGLYAARLVSITLLTTLFFLTTRSQDAIALGIKALRPLRVLGVEQQEMALLVHLAYRFVPLLSREIDEVEQGRRARNLGPEKGHLAKLKASIDKLTFLFVGAIKRAETTAYALEDRRIIEHWGRSTEVTPAVGLGGWLTATLMFTTTLLLWGDSSLL